jgi:hypothetical protein
MTADNEGFYRNLYSVPELWRVRQDAILSQTLPDPVDRRKIARQNLIRGTGKSYHRVPDEILKGNKPGSGGGISLKGLKNIPLGLLNVLGKPLAAMTGARIGAVQALEEPGQDISDISALFSLISGIPLTGQGAHLAKEAFTGKQEYNEALLAELGVTNKFARYGGGFAMDLVLDPLNLIPFAWGASAVRAAGGGVRGLRAASWARRADKDVVGAERAARDAEEAKQIGSNVPVESVNAPAPTFPMSEQMGFDFPIEGIQRLGPQGPSRGRRGVPEQDYIGRRRRGAGIQEEIPFAAPIRVATPPVVRPSNVSGPGRHRATTVPKHRKPEVTAGIPETPQRPVSTSPVKPSPVERVQQRIYGPRSLRLPEYPETRPSVISNGLLDDNRQLTEAGTKLIQDKIDKRVANLNKKTKEGEPKKILDPKVEANIAKNTKTQLLDQANREIAYRQKIWSHEAGKMHPGLSEANVTKLIVRFEKGGNYGADIARLLKEGLPHTVEDIAMDNVVRISETLMHQAGNATPGEIFTNIQKGDSATAAAVERSRVPLQTAMPMTLADGTVIHGIDEADRQFVIGLADKLAEEVNDADRALGNGADYGIAVEKGAGNLHYNPSKQRSGFEQIMNYVLEKNRNEGNARMRPPETGLWRQVRTLTAAMGKRLKTDPAARKAVRDMEGAYARTMFFELQREMSLRTSERTGKALLGTDYHGNPADLAKLLENEDLVAKYGATKLADWSNHIHSMFRKDIVGEEGVRAAQKLADQVPADVKEEMLRIAQPGQVAEAIVNAKIAAPLIAKAKAVVEQVVRDGASEPVAAQVAADAAKATKQEVTVRTGSSDVGNVAYDEVYQPPDPELQSLDRAFSDLRAPTTAGRHRKDEPIFSDEPPDALGLESGAKNTTTITESSPFSSYGQTGAQFVGASRLAGGRHIAPAPKPKPSGAGAGSGKSPPPGGSHAHPPSGSGPTPKSALATAHVVKDSTDVEKGILSLVARSFNPEFGMKAVQWAYAVGRSVRELQAKRFAKFLRTADKDYPPAIRMQAIKAAQAGVSTTGNKQVDDYIKIFTKFMENRFGASGLRDEIRKQHTMFGRARITVDELNATMARKGLGDKQFGDIKLPDGSMTDLTKGGTDPLGILDSWRYWDFGDDLDTISRMSSAIEETLTNRSTFELLARTLGTTKPSGEFRYAVEASEKFAAQLNGVYFREDIAKQINTLIKVMKTFDDPTNPLLRTYDNALRIWKTGVTIYNPRHHVNNLIGDVSLNWLAGVNNPRYYKKAASLINSRRQVYRDLDNVDKVIGESASGANLSSKVTVTMKNGTVVTGDQIIAMADRWGIMPGAFMSEDIIQQTSRLIKGEVKGKFGPSSIPRNVRNFSEARDHYARYAHFMHELEHLKGSPDEVWRKAAMAVRKWHPDGTNLTTFERKVMRRIIPFYSWVRKALPLTVEAAVHNPARNVMVFPKAIYALQGIQGIQSQGFGDPFPEDQLFPDWMKHTTVGPVLKPGDWTPFGNTQGYGVINPTFPTFDFLDDFTRWDIRNGGPADIVRDNITPFLGWPIDLFTNTQSRGKPPSHDIEGYIVDQVPIVGRSWIGSSDLGTTIPRWFFGAPTPVDTGTESMQRQAIYDERARRNEEIRSRG